MESHRVYRWAHKRVVTPEAKARWDRAHKFVRLGITEERFNQILQAQAYACAMCRKPFGDEYPQVDHDHSCCPPPPPKAQLRLCGKCIRGLLCFRCNTALGYVERYGDLAAAYLRRTDSVTAG
jgi:hypothetical protein